MCWWAFECRCPTQGCGTRSWFKSKHYSKDQYNCRRPNCTESNPCNNQRGPFNSLPPTDIKPYERLCNDCWSRVDESDRLVNIKTERKCDLCQEIHPTEDGFDEHFRRSHSQQISAKSSLTTFLIRDWKVRKERRVPQTLRHVTESEPGLSEAEVESISVNRTQYPLSETSTSYGQTYSESGSCRVPLPLASESVSSHVQSTGGMSRGLFRPPALASSSTSSLSQYSSRTISIVKTPERLRTDQDPAESTEPLPPLRTNSAYINYTEDCDLPPIRTSGGQNQQ